MSTYDSLVDRARGIAATLNDESTALVVDLLARILDLEGPPPAPDDADASYRRGIIKHARTNQGIALVETWVKGPWRCLLIGTKSIPQARHKTRVLGDGSRVAMVDSASTTAQRRIAMACRLFRLDAPVGDCVVTVTSNQTRTFVAWRRPSPAEGRWGRELLGDVDNYAKTVLDGLQKAGTIRNDRGVIELRVSKVDPWGAPAESLEALQIRMLKDAMASGKSDEEIEALRLELGASKRLLRQLDPNQARRGPGRPASTGAARQAQVEKLLKAIDRGISKEDLKKLQEELGAPPSILRGLNKRRLEGQRKRLLEAIRKRMPAKALESLRQEIGATPSLLRRLSQRVAREGAKRARPSKSR